VVFVVCSVKRKYNITISTGKEYLVYDDDDDDDDVCDNAVICISLDWASHNIGL